MCAGAGFYSSLKTLSVSSWYFAKNNSDLLGCTDKVLELCFALNCIRKHGNLLLTMEIVKADRPSINSRVFRLVFNFILLPLVYALPF